MRRLWFGLLVVLAVLFVGLPMACGGGGGGTTTGTGGSAGNGSSSSTTGGDDVGGFGGGMNALTIQPETAEITVKNGVGSTVDFDLLSGATSLGAKWTVDKSSVAKVDDNGVVSAVGDKGGEVKVTAQYGNESRTAILTVKIQADQNPGTIPEADIGILKGAAEQDPGIVWLYPYDQTVFPKGIFPPNMMWNGGAAGDEYYIHYQTKLIDIGIFTKVDPPSRFLLDEATWRTITDSGKGGDLQLTIARLVPGQPKATIVIKHTWHIASGPLRGRVYYWSNSLGRVLRIDPAKGTPPEDFLGAAGISQPCSTCHTVSADGLTLVMGGDVPNSVFNLLNNTTTLSLPNVGKAVRNWAMPAVSPDGKALIENNAPLPGPPGGSDGMWNPQTGEKLVGTGLDGVVLDMPAFAPSGKMIAAVDHNAHSLIRYSFDASTNMVSGMTNLIDPGADPSINAICFPSVAPTSASQEFTDSTWVTYHRGVYPSSYDTRNGPGDLYLASMDTPGVELRLRNANGDDYAFPAGDRDRHFNYEPTFAPEEAGGYDWIVFTSRRTYGNLLTGDKTVVKQLWIAAVDIHPQPGQDPSHPAFWVPGQDANLNMRGFWAHEPCKPANAVCTVDDDCCGGTCSNGMCAGDPSMGCVDEGGSCKIDADCCDASTCQNGVCGGAK